MPRLPRLLKFLLPALLLAFSAPAFARTSERAQDEALAHAIGVQTCIAHFPRMDLYRTLWEPPSIPTAAMTGR